MTLPLVVILPAYGLRSLASRKWNSVGATMIGVLLVMLAITSIGGGFTDPSLANAVGQERGVQGYLTDENLAAASFVTTYSEEAEIRATSNLPGYLAYTTWIDQPTDSPDTDRYGRVSTDSERIIIEPGLTVFQERAFRESQVKVELLNPSGSVYEEGVSVNVPVSAESVAWRTDRTSVVYSNGDTVITHVGEREGSESPSENQNAIRVGTAPRERIPSPGMT